jgi:hypothetical protein
VSAGTVYLKHDRGRHLRYVLTLDFTYTPATGPTQILQETYTLDATVGNTPIPATLPLFATGLGGLGLLGWRRKRKAQAV